MPTQSGVLYTAGEDRNITAWDTNSGKVAHCIEDAHSTRVKGMVVLSKNTDASGAEDPYLMASGSSDGIIRVWDIRMAVKEKANPLAEADTKSRLTCLAGTSLKCECILDVFFLYTSWQAFYFNDWTAGLRISGCLNL